MALNQDIWLASCSGSEPTRGLLVELSCFPRFDTEPRYRIDDAGYELDVAYRRGIGTVQVPNRGTNDVRQITA